MPAIILHDAIAAVNTAWFLIKILILTLMVLPNTQ